MCGDLDMIRLLGLRSEKKLSQRDMAKKFNISQGTYNNWENSKTEPSVEQLIQLSDFFDVSVDYLIGRSDSYQYESKLEPNVKNFQMLKIFNNLSEEDQDALIRLLSNEKNKKF